ncbi:hypothetical protein [Heyndrickxia camelliae]|uniref:Uncharacterized protein n=1 Tax=Heyndrickxia camelliae TaxID=1707093 RepID=A0A2N3LJN1_9BACI|nr:hypothetical protein [Heyndrickxia camelliae]PKR84831.1 hypothetical protein CWO92_12440 [Heyndrickxia camelliae]
MKELSFAQHFTLIALNAQESTRLTNSKKVSLRCMAAAVILELYLDNGFSQVGDVLTCERGILENPSISLYQKAVLNIFFSKNETISGTLPQYLTRVVKMSKKQLKIVEDAFVANLKEENALEEIHALLSSDLEFVTAGIEMKEYRSNSESFTRVTESIRAEILEEGPVTDEAILMLWLLRESGSIYDLFSKEELKHVAERIYKLYNDSSLGKTVFPISIHNTVEYAVKNFLKMKKEIMTTPSGSGVAFVFPIIERSQSIFIDTEAYFANKEDRLNDVKDRLERNGHHIKVIREGDIPLIKIDNMLYEAVPHAKVYKFPVHGVRLLKYPLSL